MKASLNLPPATLSHQARVARTIPKDVYHFRARKAARTRAANLLERIDPNTTDPHLAIRFELHSRGISMAELAKAWGVGERYLQERFGGHARQRSFSPALLERLIKHLHIGPRRARELHTLAARKAGWGV